MGQTEHEFPNPPSGQNCERVSSDRYLVSNDINSYPPKTGDRHIPITVEFQNGGGTALGFGARISADCSKPNQTSIHEVERLIRTHCIWFIPDLTRDQAVNILHAKEEGVSNSLNFIVNIFIS